MTDTGMPEQLDPTVFSGNEFLMLRIQLDTGLITAPTGIKNIDELSRDADRYSIKIQMKVKKSDTAGKIFL